MTNQESKDLQEHLRILYKELGWAMQHVKEAYDKVKTDDTPIAQGLADEQMEMKL